MRKKDRKKEKKKYHHPQIKQSLCLWFGQKERAVSSEMIISVRG
jgi:hypothetical protein